MSNLLEKLGSGAWFYSHKPGESGSVMLDPSVKELIHFKSPDECRAAQLLALKQQITHLHELEREFNSYAESKDLDLRIDVKLQIRRCRSAIDLVREKEPLDQQDSELCANVVVNNMTGRFYPQQVRTLIDTIAGSDDDYEPHRVVFGPTQIGKSITILSVAIIEPIYRKLALGEEVESIVCAPNITQIKEQHKQALACFVSQYSQVKVYHEKEYMTIGQMIENQKHMHPSNHEVTPGLAMIHANSPSKIEEFRDRVEKAKKSKRQVLVIFDESHYGTAIDGTVDKNLKSWHKEMAKSGSDIEWRCVSATPYEQYGLDSFYSIPHWITTSYHGPSRFMNHSYPVVGGTSEDITTPRFESIDVVLENLKKDSVALDWRAFHKNDKFLQHIEGVEDREQRAKMLTKSEKRWLKYRSDFVDTVFDIAHGCLYQKGFKSPFSKANFTQSSDKNRGCMFRISRRNDDAIMIADKLEHLIEKNGLKDKLVVIRSWGGQPETMKDIIAASANRKKKYIVLVTAGARMGVSFPSHCRYFFDLTPRISTCASELQGTAGRACGHNKDSIVFYQEDQFKSMQALEQTGYVISHRHHSMRTERGFRKANRGGKSFINTILLASDFQPGDEQYGMFQDLRDIISDNVYVPRMQKLGLKKWPVIKGADGRKSQRLTQRGLFDSPEEKYEVVTNEIYRLWTQSYKTIQFMEGNPEFCRCDLGKTNDYISDPDFVYPLLNDPSGSKAENKVLLAQKGKSSKWVSDHTVKGGKRRWALDNQVGLRQYNPRNKVWTLRTNKSGKKNKSLEVQIVWEADNSKPVDQQLQIVAIVFPMRTESGSAYRADSGAVTVPNDKSAFKQYGE